MKLVLLGFKMKITFFPKTKLGKWSVSLIIIFFVLLGIFSTLIYLGERGGETYFSNLKLVIPFTLAWLSAIASFFIGTISFFKKERAILVFISVIIGFLVLWFIIAEFSFPH